MSKTHFESWISFQNTTKDHATDRLCSFSRHSCKSNKVKFTPETLKNRGREKSADFAEFSPENPAKFCFFFREISEALN